MALLCSGCISLYDPEASQEQNNNAIVTIQDGQEFEQTFVSRRGRLNALALWLALPSETPREGVLLVSLYQDSDSDLPVAVSRLGYASVARNNPLTIHLPPQSASAGKAYRLVMTADGGPIQVLGRMGDVYPLGEVRLNGEKVSADAAFRLYYDYDYRAFLQDICLMLSKAWLLFPTAILLFLPGYLALDLLGPVEEFDGIQRFALALGFSLAIVPVLMAWSSMIQVRWNATVLWFTAGLFVAVIVWRRRHSLGHLRLSISTHSLAFITVLIPSMVVRMIMVRDLSAPPWVDSVHHGLITRLILINGGYPSNDLPFLPIDFSQYHPGFHSVLASFLWLSGLDIRTGMLIFGQVLNALAVAAVYLLAVSLTGNRRAGVMAALIAAIFTPMPAYYTSWGRYTHLDGLLILPAAFTWVKQLLEYPSKTLNIGKLKVLLISGITCAGLFLTHYRVAGFLACLLLAYWLMRAFPHPKWSGLLREAGVILLAGGVALGILAPWMPTMFKTLIIPRLSLPLPSTASTYNTFAWSYLTAGLGKYTLILAGLGFFWSLIRRSWFSLILLLWFGFLFAISNSDRLGLPGARFINNTSVQISMFIPIAILGGYFAIQLFDAIRKWLPVWAGPYFTWGSVILSLALTIVGMRNLIPILNPITFLYREADTRAIEWMQANIPEGETVLINPFAWGYGLYAGSDGGYWLSPLAGRKSMPPPVLYGMDNNPDRIKDINTTIKQVIENSNNPDELATILRAKAIRYIYIGAKGGPLTAQILESSPAFTLLYHQNGTWVFKLKE